MASRQAGGRGGGERYRWERSWNDDGSLLKIKELNIRDFPIKEVSIPEEITGTSEVFLKKIWTSIMESSLKITNDVEDNISKYFKTFSDTYWNLLRMLMSWNQFYMRVSDENTKNDYIQIGKRIVSIFLELNLLDNLLLTADIKLAAFQLISKLDVDVFKNANIIYEFDRQPQNFMNDIKHLMFYQKYETAGHWVAILKLQKQFVLTDILLPLTLQKRSDVISLYLDGETEERQKEFILILETLCDGKALNQMIEKLHIKDAGIDKPRILAKTGLHLAKRFKIALDVLPNIKKWQYISTIGYLIHAQYREGKFNDEDWEDFVTDFTKKNFILQIEALRIVAVTYKDAGRAFQWAKKWGFLTKKLRDEKLAQAINLGRTQPLLPIPKPLVDVNYYDPTLPNIYFVTRRAGYFECIDHIAKSAVVGLDSEWKSRFGLNDDLHTAVLQIGTEDKIYLLDVINLRSQLAANEWGHLSTKLFENPKITKLAFSFEDDWKNLVYVCPKAFEDTNYQTTSFIDIRNLFDTMMENCPQVFPFHNPSETYSKRGLSQCAELCFNLPMDKREQIGNWERRPLRNSQMNYAALDVYCLLKMYHLFKNRCIKLQIDFDELVKISQQIATLEK